MNLEEILMNVQAQFDISADEIDWSDDETIARKKLANIAIQTWQKADNTMWNELFTIQTTEPLKEGANEFELPNYDQFDSVVIEQDNSALEVRNIRNTKNPGIYGFIEGNSSDGYKLKIGKSISKEDNLFGKNLRICYYKKPKLLEDKSDIPEMSDPSYIVDYVCAAVASDDDMNKFSIFSTNHVNKLSVMIAKNYQIYVGEEDTVLNDNNLIIGM